MNCRVLNTLLALVVGATILIGCGGDRNAAAHEAESAAAETPATGAKQNGDWEIVVTPESETVAPGIDFKAKITIQNLSEGVIPEFMGSGRIAITDSGKAADFFLKALGGFEKGKSEKEQKYAITVKIRMADGNVLTKVHEGKFMVRQSSLIVTPDPSQPLYSLVGTAITLDAPEMGDNFRPVVTASGADVIPDRTQSNKFVIIPSPHSKQVVMEVKSLTNGLMTGVGEVIWESVDPPLPEFKLVVNGKEYDGKSAIPKKGTAVLKVVPDKEFQMQFPKDARYMMTAAMLKAGGKTLDQKSGSGKDATKGVELDLSKLKDLKSGDEVTFEISGLFRLNFQNKQAKVKGEFKITAKMK